MPDCSLPETLFPITTPDCELRVSFETVPTVLLVGNVGLLSDVEKLTSEQVKCPLLAALKATVL